MFSFSMVFCNSINAFVTDICLRMFVCFCGVAGLVSITMAQRFCLLGVFMHLCFSSGGVGGLCAAFYALCFLEGLQRGTPRRDATVGVRRSGGWRGFPVQPQPPENISHSLTSGLSSDSGRNPQICLQPGSSTSGRQMQPMGFCSERG